MLNDFIPTTFIIVSYQLHLFPINGLVVCYYNTSTNMDHQNYEETIIMLISKSVFKKFKICHIILVYNINFKKIVFQM